jgi:hypothetical protein
VKFPVTLTAFVGVSLAVAAQTPASAAQKHQRPAARYTSLNTDRANPPAPVQAAAILDPGTEIAIRLQDAHRGDGPL